MSDTENLTVEEVVVVPHIEPNMNLTDVYPGEHKGEFVGVPPIERAVDSTIIMQTEMKDDSVVVIPPEQKVEQVITPVEIVKSPGCFDKITAKLSDQDFTQKMSVYISFIFELYRVVMGSFLILFAWSTTKK